MKSVSQRLLRPDGRALYVAMDHARDWGPLPGLERPQETIERVLAAGADGVMTTYGTAKLFGQLVHGRARLVVRLDGWSSCYREQWPEYSGWQQLYSVEAALRVGADAVICNYFLGAAGESASLLALGHCAEEADRLGVPLVVESVPCAGSKLADPSDARHLAVGARIAFEHGADMIKTFYSGDAASFRTVVEGCPLPVMVAGGVRQHSEPEALQLVYGGMTAGARGVFLGKNIWRSADPAGMVRALSAIIHDGATPDQAARHLTR